ncbi:hypothetical protein KDA14_05030, partial [Candidatus Saccharibacteria bacterium]|nr:hypothetical protein [Candidatus Saccharibacteria bacterium]
MPISAPGMLVTTNKNTNIFKIYITWELNLYTSVRVSDSNVNNSTGEQACESVGLRKRERDDVVVSHAFG